MAVSVLIDAPTAYFGNDTAVSLPTGTITVPLADGVTGATGDGSYEVVFVSNEEAVYGAGVAGPALHCVKGVAYYDQRVHRIGSFLVVNGKLQGNQDLRTIGGVTTANIQDKSVTPEKLTGKIVQTVSGVEPIIVDDTDTTNPIIKLDTPLAVVYGGTGTATPNLIEGDNITISGTWPNLTIAAAGYTGDGTITQTQVRVTAPLTNSATTTAPNLGLAIPLDVQYGGTGTVNPHVTPGNNVVISGIWPNITIGVIDAVQTLGVTSPITLGGTALNPIIGLQVPLPVNLGGTGSPHPSLIEGNGIVISGTWPNQIVSATGGAGAGGTTYLREDGDVALTDPANGQVLTYQGGEWINADAPGTALIVVAPIVNTGTPDAPVLTLQNPLPINKGGSGSAAPSLIQGANIIITGTWPNQTIAAVAGSGSLAADSDVTITSPTNGQILMYESGKWVNAAPPSGSGASGSSTLAGDSDVTITSPVNGQILIYESGKWINSSAPVSTAVATSVIVPSDFVFNFSFPTTSDDLEDETGATLDDETGAELMGEADGASSMYWWVSGLNVALHLPDGTVPHAAGIGSETSPHIYTPGASTTIYVLAYATLAGSTWTITVAFFTVQPTAAQLAPAYAVGVIPLIAKYLALVGTTGSGINGTLLGGAGSGMIC